MADATRVGSEPKAKTMDAALGQGKAKVGMAVRTSPHHQGGVPIISDVPGFKAYYVTRSANARLFVKGRRRS
jgi:hypothetical protein